jgi:hypothetical protein
MCAPHDGPSRRGSVVGPAACRWPGARTAGRRHGRGGADQRGLCTPRQGRGRGGWPSSGVAAVLEATPGAGLAGQWVRAAGAAARTRKDEKCKRRAGEARLDIGRVIGREARTPPRPGPARSKSQRPGRQRRRPHEYSAAVACEFPSWAELVRHGGVLIKPARGVGDGRVGRRSSWPACAPRERPRGLARQPIGP